ncbi:chromate resistance protein ChrB domain-containing protein [Methylobacter sp. YRD-M1]|uniref:chromate resistance protein ChrB domain-containing protein n=1 Tax=Methylobacter sp. YRD-M1 TaxID=2911520 RepID=UPI00227D3CA9|nr:chromate resistance protein ChrB domain-containing protein [Methylobacter sp. YRD-M1]WAK00282.1 chromate resistance protein [Methylobacter sp. YRD-M1]
MSYSWLIFIVSLPTRNAAGRMRVWRALKALGCGVLRDGVYLLPYHPEFRQTLQLQAEDVAAGGGNAHILALNSETDEQQALFEHFFDRSADYAKLVEGVRQTADMCLQTEDPAKLQKQVHRLRKDFEAIALQDFFPGAAQEQTAAALEDLEHAVHERLVPDEPHAVQQQIKRLQPQDYQHRIWATRQRPWIDRLASAWLIRRFIDSEARIIWLRAPADCPAEALGFDFDGAVFTHVGAKITFEVLLASFGLTKDAALNRIGALVHYLDAGGIPVLEAVGLETLMSGMRQRWTDDDKLLAEAEKIFDAFYQAFQEPTHE